MVSGSAASMACSCYGEYLPDPMLMKAGSQLPVFRRVHNGVGGAMYLFFLADESMWCISRKLWTPPFALAAVSSAPHPMDVSAGAWMRFENGGLVSKPAPDVVLACTPRPQCQEIRFEGLRNGDPQMGCTGTFLLQDNSFHGKPVYASASHFAFYANMRWVVGSKAPLEDVLLPGRHTGYCMVSARWSVSAPATPFDVRDGRWSVSRTIASNQRYEPAPVVRCLCADHAAPTHAPPTRPPSPPPTGGNAELQPELQHSEPEFVEPSFKPVFARKPLVGVCQAVELATGPYGGMPWPRWAAISHCMGLYRADLSQAPRKGSHSSQGHAVYRIRPEPATHKGQLRGCALFWRPHDRRWVLAVHLDGAPLIAAAANSPSPEKVRARFWEWRRSADAFVPLRKGQLRVRCVSGDELRLRLRAPATIEPYRQHPTPRPTPRPTPAHTEGALRQKPMWCHLSDTDYINCISDGGCCERAACVLYRACHAPTPYPTNSPAPTPAPVVAYVRTTVFINDPAVERYQGAANQRRFAAAAAQAAGVKATLVTVGHVIPFTSKASGGGFAWVIHGTSLQLRIKTYQSTGFLEGCPRGERDCAGEAAVATTLGQTDFAQSLSVFLLAQGFHLAAPDVRVDPPQVGSTIFGSRASVAFPSDTAGVRAAQGALEVAEAGSAAVGSAAAVSAAAGAHAHAQRAQSSALVLGVLAANVLALLVCLKCRRAAGKDDGGDDDADESLAMIASDRHGLDGSGGTRLTQRRSSGEVGRRMDCEEGAPLVAGNRGAESEF